MDVEKGDGGIEEERISCGGATSKELEDKKVEFFSVPLWLNVGSSARAVMVLLHF